MYRAIIADDEERILRGLTKQVESLNLGVTVAATAQDGEETLRLMEKYSPELLIIDINMPLLNGLECIKKIRETQANCMIIILSGYDKFEYAQQAIQHEVAFYLLKPVEDDEFKKAIAKCIDMYEKRMEKINLLNKYAPDTDVNPESVIRFIKENYANARMSIKWLEKRFNLSRSSLFKIIKNATGRNFTDYLTELRMEHAKRLLRDKAQYPVKTIADLVGYSNQHYFSRAFKSYTRLSPKQYQQSLDS